MPIQANLSFSSPNYFSDTISDHIVCSLDYFHTYSKIKPMNINLPNGTFVKAQISGSIHFSPSFAIHNVLYVLDFTFNLLSISKLLSTLEYVITFSNDSCQIQEASMLKTIASIHDHKYFLTILDDHSRYTWVILLKSKAEVKSHIQNFVALIENQFETTIKCIRSDNGLEFLLKDFFSSKGIIQQTSCVYTPQQNGRVERKHQHILNVARALMFQSQIPNNFWCYAIKHAMFLINHVPSPVILNKTPFELLYKQKPDFSMLKVFGCMCFASINTHHHKFEARS
uniref:Retrovirus-related Pol polyprotein from transposon TNT 1-94 n=1 Tax=Cajanus cajan TaxID=3821 RepID=A0A151R5T4_CAJCA|nr:Retrovirus-related Pol polyprotein from transposon TNT 1-94 [Cajanus cajan]